MKTEENNTKSAVEQLKEIRDKISFEIKDMSPADLKKYIDEKLKLHPVAERKNHSK